MTALNVIFQSVCSLLAATVIASNVNAAETVWVTNPDMPTLFSSELIGPSVLTPSTDQEVADDFNVIGMIEQVIADGDDCPGCFSGQPVIGVHVRFYQWTASGPGVLQSEQFLAANDPNFNWTPAFGPEFLQITLPVPFQASGWHYISVQVEFSAQSSSTGKWSFHPINFGQTMGSGAYVRDNSAAAPVWILSGPAMRDASFKLVGVPGGPTPMEILTATSEPITPSARLSVTGDGFGESQDDGAVLINDAPAIVTQWSNNEIVAYVPEQTAVGVAELTVINANDESDTLNIDVQPRVADGPVQWRFAVDADLMFHRPGVAPDGSIYINDYNHGNLYKLSPDGGLVWVVDALRGQLGDGSEGPIAIADDGTIILAVNPLGPTVEVVAFNPDGTLKWVFTNPQAYTTLAGPTFGPDGNLYVIFSVPFVENMGATSLTPDGELRWANGGEGGPRVWEFAAIGANVTFSSSQGIGGEFDQVIVPVEQDGAKWLFAFDMASGDQNYVLDSDNEQSVVMMAQPEAGIAPNGAVYLSEFGAQGPGWGLQQRDPADGSVNWRFEPEPGILSEMTIPVVDGNGRIYFGWDLARVTAVSPQGSELWTHDAGAGGVRRMPAVSPNNQVVLFGGGPFGQSGYIRALDAATGNSIFQVDLHSDAGDVIAVDRPTFTPDSTTAYYPTDTLGDIGSPHSYLYAITLPVVEPPTRPADITGDGHVNVDDLLAIINSWGPCADPANCPADIAPTVAGDGAVNVDDLLMVINNWD